jgi:hypothetical protein
MDPGLGHIGRAFVKLAVGLKARRKSVKAAKGRDKLVVDQSE